MKENEIIKTLMKEQNIKPKMLANRLNEAHNTVLGRLNRERWTVGVLLETLRVLDYKLMVVPSDTRETKGTFTID